MTTREEHEDLNDEMPDVQYELHTGVADHQFLLSFNSDTTCEAFHEWWGETGSALWRDALNERLHEGDIPPF